MNSCNTIRSVELLYYCYYYCWWCTYILARYSVNALLLYYLNLLSCLLCFSIFLVYISCFSLFLFDLISLPLFFKRRLPEFIIFFRCENVYCSCSCSSCIQNFSKIIMQKEPFVYFMGRFQLCFVCSIILLFNVSLNS